MRTEAPLHAAVAGAPDETAFEQAGMADRLHWLPHGVWTTVSPLAWAMVWVGVGCDYRGTVSTSASVVCHS